MSSTALISMIIIQGSVTAIAAYLYYKILRKPGR